MAATYVVVTNATTSQLSLVGDDGSARYDIPPTAGSNFINLNLSELIGNTLLCTTLSTWITSGKVTVTRGGVTITAAEMLAWEVGSDMSRVDFDADDDTLIDAAESLSDGSTSVTATALFAAMPHVASLAVGHADLTATATTQTLSFAAALPDDAIILAAYADITEAFTDGAAGTFTIDVGVSGSDVLLDAADITSIAKVGTPTGTVPSGWYAGSTITVKVDSSVNVDTATAGAMRVKVIYITGDDALA